MDRLRPNGADFKIQPEFRHPVVIEAGREVVPCAGRNEIILVTLAPFRDHERPALVGSTIKSRAALVAAASELSEDDGQRLDSLRGRVVDQFLDTGKIVGNGVFTSHQDGKPDIHVLVLGDPWKETSLRLYCHVGEYRGTPVLYQDAKTRKKSAERVERVLRVDGGYLPPKSWLNKSRSGE